MLYLTIRRTDGRGGNVVGRVSGWKNALNTLVIHYGDRITQQSNPVTSLTQNFGQTHVVTGPTASTACLGSSTASCTLNLTDMRGDVVATAAITSGVGTVSGYSEQTEFGQPRSQSTQNAVAPLYGWLGTHEKAENNLSGLVLMGARVYNPTTSLFSASDPVYQGNANPYTYPGDPVNAFDLSGDSGKWTIQACKLLIGITAFCNIAVDNNSPLKDPHEASAVITAGKDDADQIERDMKRIQSKLISEEEHYTESDLSAQDYSLNLSVGAAISSVERRPLRLELEVRVASMG